MNNLNLFIYMNKYLDKTKNSFIKKKLRIKIFNRNLRVSYVMKNFNIGIYNGKYFIPVHVDDNKLNFMLGTFSFSFSIKLRKKVKIYKKKKNKKKK